MEAYSTTWEASAQSLYSGQVFPLPPRAAPVKTPARKQQNSPASYTTYKHHNNCNTITPIIVLCPSWAYWLCAWIGDARVWDSSHRRSVFTKWARPTNFPDNNNDLQNETTTKVAYLMCQTAWIANTLADFFCSQIIRTSRRHFANTNKGHFEKLHQTL